MMFADAAYLQSERANYFTPPVQPAGLNDSGNPSTLDPNLWALEIMGILGYYHMLSDREASVTAGSPEDQWLKGQMADCTTFIANAEKAETAYEQANPGKTYLGSTFCDILKQAGQQMGTSGYSKWMIDTYMNLDGTGTSIIDWFNQIVGVEPALSWPSGSGQSQTDMEGFSFASTFLFVDLDNTALGQMGGVDAYFSVNDYSHPFNPYKFPSAGPEMICYYLWNSCGQPAPGSSGWTDFTTDLGYFGNMLNPANLPQPTPTNYQQFFWKNFQTDETDFDNGQFPGGDSLTEAFEAYLKAFNVRFIQ